MKRSRLRDGTVAIRTTVTIEDDHLQNVFEALALVHRYRHAHELARDLVLEALAQTERGDPAFRKFVEEVESARRARRRAAEAEARAAHERRQHFRVVDGGA